MFQDYNEASEFADQQLLSMSMQPHADAFSSTVNEDQRRETENAAAVNHKSEAERRAYNAEKVRRSRANKKRRQEDAYYSNVCTQPLYSTNIDHDLVQVGMSVRKFIYPTTAIYIAQRPVNSDMLVVANSKEYLFTDDKDPEAISTVTAEWDAMTQSTDLGSYTLQEKSRMKEL
eukprot:1326412-Rhodomonas_salina.1